MDTQLRNSLEALTNLLFLVRSRLHDPEAASAYLKLAEEQIKALASQLENGARLSDS
jgi:hypothetical protein